MNPVYFHYILYFFAYTFSLTAFFFNSVRLLRIFTIISSSCYALYYFSFPADPMWLDIGTEGLLVLVNIAMLLIVYFRKQKSVLSTEEKEIYKTMFSDFSPFEFYKLVKAARWKNYNPEHQLILKGATVEDIHFIYSGEVSVKLSDHRNIVLRDGYFLGERSFSLNEYANADVKTTDTTRLLSWNQNELKNLFKRNPAMKKSFEQVITTDLAKKLDL